MGPTYTTNDPMALHYSGDGLVVEERADDRVGEGVPIPNPRMVISNPGNARRMARMNGYNGFGQAELPVVYASEDVGAYTIAGSTGPGILDSLGNALGNIIRTIGYQAPGMITGQPTSGYYPAGYIPPSPLSGISPLLLIGGGIALVWYLSKK